ncbi:hypothetical protein Syun_008087 [Stephania yunnanensis]|uniref:N-acetyltransferase domain-containing protein n=1 Tax=Stephania yunnanensis TaxID=152371 RepID=A0AAP0KZX7_9MAGN
MDARILIREFNEDRDVEEVESLERESETWPRKGVSIFTNMMRDPLCRIRLYPNHVMLVAELVNNGELVGVVRGCIKHVGTGIEETNIKMCCILGLRVSSKHRQVTKRQGIGLKLVESVEGWATENGSEYIFLAAEENNIASANLFVKCNYRKLSSLIIYSQPIDSHSREKSFNDIRIEKLSIEQAISLYKDRLGSKLFFPVDIDAILNEKLSLGTWVSFFREEDWISLHSKDKSMDFTSRTPSSWVVVSIWKTCEAYKLEMRRQHSLSFLYAALAKVFPCLRIPVYELLCRPFGFLFLYGLYGEGERLGELMKSMWSFACNLAGSLECKMISTEVGACDPLKEHIPRGISMSCVNDDWFFKKANGPSNDDDNTWKMSKCDTTLFVDPRDF